MLKFEFIEILFFQKNMNFILFEINPNITLSLLKYKIDTMKEIEDRYSFNFHSDDSNSINISMDIVIIDCVIKYCELINTFALNNEMLHISFKNCIVIKNTTIYIRQHYLMAKDLLQIYFTPKSVEKLHIYVSDNNFIQISTKEPISTELFLCENRDTSINVINHLK